MAENSQEGTIRIVSLNCWGLKYVSKHRKLRLEGIADLLSQKADQYDIVALQEIWVEEDFRKIEDRLSKQLCYSKFYYGGILTGPGLAVFSRWPIESVSTRPFTLNGRPSAFFRGDWYVGKSVASAIIRHPLQKIELLSSHMHAPYGEGDAAYTCHRTAQAWEMAHMSRRSIDSGHLAIAVGDLNSIPGSATYKLLQMVGGLADSWVEKHGHFSGDIGKLSYDDQIRIAGVTCDSLLNTWRADRQPHEAKRLDYIFFDPSRAAVKDSRVSFIEKLDVGSCSDHFALETDLVLSTNKINSSHAFTATDVRGLFKEILDLIDEYRPTSIWQKNVRILHFWISFVVLVGMCVSVFWGAANGRAYVGFVYLVVGILITITGLLDGLIGFLFGRHEMRALREFASQVEMESDVLEMPDA